ncbi:MAG: GNAT family N-acetyltransferase [Bacteroides sp.]|nr:GNAT family N-acetyltransferase [Bacteroides sp.]
MSKKDDIKKIWLESFGDSQEYVDMYFDRVYADSQGLILEKNDKPVSSLLLQSYRMQFHGREVETGYIAGAATRKGSRGKGYMSELLLITLAEAASRGMMAVELIPEHGWLYDYYSRFDFAPVVLADAQRFTSLHAFPCNGKYVAVENPYDDAVFDTFSRLERERPCTVVHSRRDFLNIIDDCRLSGGSFVCIRREDSTTPVAMAWAAMDADGERLIVKELLGEDDDARAGALKALREAYPNVGMTLLALPGQGTPRGRLTQRGMIRIVNAAMALDIIASTHPELKLTLRITDRLMPENSHVYVIDAGKCEIDDTLSGPYDFSVDAEIFARILFSSEKTGDILEFPSVRPHMSLMLD